MANHIAQIAITSEIARHTHGYADKCLSVAIGLPLAIEL